VETSRSRAEDLARDEFGGGLEFGQDEARRVEQDIAA
jgi:hypothetical protein